MNEKQVLAVVLALVGGGCGALAAHFAGAASWPDAKLYIVFGVALGILANAIFRKFEK